jgi:hypothetical protein
MKLLSLGKKGKEILPVWHVYMCGFTAPLIHSSSEQRQAKVLPSQALHST